MTISFSPLEITILFTTEVNKRLVYLRYLSNPYKYFSFWYKFTSF